MTAGHDHHGEVQGEAFWNERYRSTGALWSGRPNPQLVAEAADLTPGTALDVGCGEGADALWLAERGWRVTGVDIATVALQRAADHARQAGVEVTWLHADLLDWVPPPSAYDLVSAQFLHLPPGQRATLHDRLADAVAPGGSLLIVGHHPSDLHTTAPRPPASELFFTAGEIAAALDPERWDIVVGEARPRESVDPEGRTVTVHDTVLRARREGQHVVA